MTNGSSLGETFGLDLSDKTGLFVVIDASGEVVHEGKVALTLAGVRKSFGARQPCRIAIEVGTHSPWLSRELERLGYEVIVANARQVGLIARGQKKTDRVDAETLARAARFDPQLLRPVRHRGEQAQADLAMLRARKALVESRTRLVNSVRGMVKAVGGRLPKCSTASFATKVQDHLPQSLRPALEPMLAAIAGLTEQIKAMTRDLKQLARERYPETGLLTQVHDVGLITSLTYVLTLEEPARFPTQPLRRGLPRHGGARASVRVNRSRSCGSPRRAMSTCAACWCSRAQHILGPYGKDSDLRRWGLQSGGDRQQDPQAQGGDRRGTQALGAATQALAYGRGLRAAAAATSDRRRRLKELLGTGMPGEPA